MAKRKLQRFAENETFNHFFQPGWEELSAGFSLHGKWNSDFFRNYNPVIIEVGCGKGEYTVELAKKYTTKNFIGIDKKGARMWRGAKTSDEEKHSNVAFVRVRAENICKVFGEAEVDEIWITFPEPQPNSPRHSKRFTSPEFIERFKKILKPGGIIHLKTDNINRKIRQINFLQILTFETINPKICRLYGDFSNFDGIKYSGKGFKNLLCQLFGINFLVAVTFGRMKNDVRLDDDYFVNCQFFSRKILKIEIGKLNGRHR